MAGIQLFMYLKSTFLVIFLSLLGIFGHFFVPFVHFVLLCEVLAT